MDSGQTSGPNSYKYSYTFLKSSGHPIKLYLNLTIILYVYHIFGLGVSQQRPATKFTPTCTRGNLNTWKYNYIKMGGAQHAYMQFSKAATSIQRPAYSGPKETVITFYCTPVLQKWWFSRQSYLFLSVFKNQSLIFFLVKIHLLLCFLNINSIRKIEYYLINHYITC